MDDTIYKFPCNILIPKICITRYQKTNDFVLDHEELKREICKGFSFYMSTNCFYLNGTLFTNENLEDNLLNEEIISEFTINLKTDLHVEFNTIVDDTLPNNFSNNNHFYYEISIFNHDVKQRINIFNKKKEDTKLGNKAIAIFYDDIDKSLQYNNLMAIFGQILKIIKEKKYVKEKNIKIVQNQKILWQECTLFHYNSYQNVFYIGTNFSEVSPIFKSNCFVKLENDNNLFTFKDVNILIEYPNKIKRIANIFLKNRYFLRNVRDMLIEIFNIYRKK